MKKTLLAVAVAAALPAAAFAQTNVTLYGIADAGVGWQDNDVDGQDGSLVVNSGYNSTSRFGIRGTEDLGSGLKATFNLEGGVQFDTGRSDADIPSRAAFWNRRAVVGLAGGFGEVRFGRDYTPAFSSAGSTDIMGYGLLGNWLTFTVQGGIETRANNGVHYTGTFSGITIRAVYADGEQPKTRVGGIETVDGASGDIWGLSAAWAGGPLTVQGYYQEVNTRASTTAPITSGGDSVKQMGVGAGYNFGAFRLALNYGIADADNGTTVTAMRGDKFQGLGLGAGVKLGTGELLAQIMQFKVDNAANGLRDPKAKGFGLAYIHPLSKRTNLYATYGMMRNNSNASFALLASDVAVGSGALGSDPQGFAVGIRHLF
ncbi:MAG: porin [Burkholderiaceae bacterium]|nr:porin [Burkholderiaceae bacterium]